MKTLATLALFAALGAKPAGCGGDDKDIHCVDRSGSYRVQMKLQTGSCAKTTESVLDTAKPSECTGTPKVSENNCEVSRNEICPDGTGGSTAQISGTETWAPDGEGGSATLMISKIDDDGTRGCKATYNVTYTRP